MTEKKLSSSHPLLPPTTEDDQISWLRLLRSQRVGVSTFYRLMAEYGSAQAALAALPDIAAAAGVTRYQVAEDTRIFNEIETGHKAGASLCFIGDPDYPAALAELSDAPPVLWCIGSTDHLQRPMIALVGARSASSLGTRMAHALATELGSAGYLIVSGLARGVDTAAHLASLETGTVAVLAGGVDVLYPGENAQLARDIPQHGIRLSEQPMGLAPMARHFPARNRIISGLAQGVVVIEAAVKSGSLITARNALDQGREVLAVPGHPLDARAAGCNLLLRDGAKLVRNAHDVIEALSPIVSVETRAAGKPETSLCAGPGAPRPDLSRPDISELHMNILDRLSPSPIAEDQLIRDLNRASAQVSPALIDLELAGKITRLPGGLLSRTV